MGITTAKLPHLNCNMVYKMIYENNGVSKNMISQQLNFCLPTISQNLNTLLDLNKIYRGTTMGTTGGRPAVLYHFNADAKIAIGVEVLAERLNVAAVNLRGTILKEDSLDLPFLASAPYFSTVGVWLNRFIDSLKYEPENILGIIIAIQGIVSADEEHVSYSKILNSDSFTRSDFARYFSYPLFLAHDTEMAAIAEQWHNASPDNIIYLSINPFLGSAFIINGTVLHTPHLSSGTIEHMTLHPGGNLCYCGKRGCVDAYCSVNSLIRNSAENLPTFFQHVRTGNLKAVRVWHNYLKELALLLDNVRMVLGSDVLIGGLLGKYFTEEDLQYIKQSVLSYTTFKNADFTISKGHFGEKAVLVGAALTLIRNYLKEEALIS